MTKIKKALDTTVSLLHYPKIVRKLAAVNSNLFFIFPTYQIGGAERVHADIMASVAHLNPTCIITSIPINNGFKSDFEKSATLIELKRWGTKKSFMPIMAKKVARAINKQNKPIVFSCNANLFYDLSIYLKPHVKIIDLTHSFTDHRRGMEYYSLPFVSRIDQRIVLGNKTLNGYKLLYKEHHIPPKYLDRFKIISNQVKAPNAYTEKKTDKPLTIVFVSRNSKEKRPGIFLQIADECLKQKLPVEFIMVGDFVELENDYRNKIQFTGEIRNKNVLNEIYKTAHLILITSTLEGFPMVLLEGMAYGVVPISTDVGEIPFFISEDSNTGFLVDQTLSPLEIVESFVEIIKKCIRQPELMSSFSRTSYELVKREFNSAKFEEAYQNLLIEKP